MVAGDFDIQAVPALRISYAHRILEVLQANGPQTIAELLASGDPEQLFKSEREHRAPEERARHLVQFIRRLGLATEEEGRIALTAAGERYVSSMDPSNPWAVSAEQSLLLREALEQGASTDGMLTGAAILLRLSTTAPSDPRPSREEFGRALASVGNAMGWNSPRTFESQAARFLALLEDMRLIDSNNQVTTEGHEMLESLDLEGVPSFETALETVAEGKERVWLIRAGEDGEAEKACLEGGYCGVGWRDLPDLSSLGEEGVKAEIDVVYGDQPQGRVSNFKMQIRHFMEISIGDLVLLPLKTNPGHVAVGRITGPYEHHPELSDATNHTRATSWLSSDVSKELLGAIKTTLDRPLTVGPIDIDPGAVLKAVETQQPIPTSNDEPTEVREIFGAILDLLQTGSDRDGLAQLLSDARARLSAIIDGNYEIGDGAGIGTPADVPWLGIYPPGSTASAQVGYYAVYLFAADGSAVYLSLNQGTEKVRGGLNPLRKRALDLWIAAGLSDKGDEIDLGKPGGRPARYEAASAYALKYPADSLPNDETIEKDLQELLSALERAQESQLEFHPEFEPIHLIFKWSTEKEPQTIERHQAVADAKGSVWWGKFGSGPHAISKRKMEDIQAQLDEGIATFAYLYGGGTLYRTRIEEITTNPAEVDEDRMAGYYTKDECSLFTRVRDFDPLPVDTELSHHEGQRQALVWLVENVVLASEPTPANTAGALSNQTTPLFVYQLFAGTGGTGGVSEPVLDMQWLQAETLWTADELTELLDALDSTGQVILAGPPGTGKTWVAEKVARYLTQDQPLQRRIVQFHPSYGYEEFVEGLRPVAEDGAISFKRKDGVILEIADSMEEGDLYVLIIDELNRANIPRVFGELLYLLEYRDQAVDLQYSRDFALPGNLKIIATMNTADRSTRSIDIALRRRFELFECPADSEVLSRFYAGHGRTTEVDNLIPGFTALNKELSGLIDRHHTIGQSFFMRQSHTKKDLHRTWERQILPLLDDYFFDQPDLVEQFTLEKFWPDS